MWVSSKSPQGVLALARDRFKRLIIFENGIAETSVHDRLRFGQHQYFHGLTGVEGKAF